MKKIPCIYLRDDKGILQIGKWNPLCEWVREGRGVATGKWDGSACMFDGQKLFKRYDCKKGKTPPPDFMPCEDAPDLHTGHWPGWVPLTETDYWHHEALKNTPPKVPGTYELIGPKVQGNPHNIINHALVLHGDEIILSIKQDASNIEQVLAKNPSWEGIVWHHDLGMKAKITRKHLGMKWPTPQACETLIAGRMPDWATHAPQTTNDLKEICPSLVIKTGRHGVITDD